MHKMKNKKVLPTLLVTEIQRFCMHDGPGIRTTVFLKGCPLRCAWCHNPETQKRTPELLFTVGRCIGCGACAAVCPAGAHALAETHGIDRTRCIACGRCAEVCPSRALEISGREMTVEEILAAVERDRAFYGAEGGITLSGGEPLLAGEGAVALLRACRERGIPTAVETAGAFDLALIPALLPLVDLFLFDVKDTDDARHRTYVGASNVPILANLRRLSEGGARIRMRCILVAGVNTDEAHATALTRLARSLPSLVGVELLSYHAYGGSKATLLGFPDNGRMDWIPDEETVHAFRARLLSGGVCVL